MTYRVYEIPEIHHLGLIHRSKKVEMVTEWDMEEEIPELIREAIDRGQIPDVNLMLGELHNQWGGQWEVEQEQMEGERKEQLIQELTTWIMETEEYQQAAYKILNRDPKEFKERGIRVYRLQDEPSVYDLITCLVMNEWR